MSENKLHNLAKDLTGSVEQSVKVINFLLIISIIIMLVVFFKHYTRQQETFFARSFAGNVQPMLPLNQFNISPRSLLNWSMVATTNIFTMDFENYAKTLEEVSEFFTKSGLEKFKASLIESGRLDEIIDKKLITSAVVVDCPIIVAEGVQGSTYFWKIQLPVAVTFQGASEEIYQQWLIVTLLIKKVANKELKKGIGIENLTTDKIAPMY